MQHYDQFPDVPPFLLGDVTDPSILPDPDSLPVDVEVDLPTEVNEELTDKEIVDIETEEDNDDIIVGADDDDEDKEDEDDDLDEDEDEDIDEDDN